MDGTKKTKPIWLIFLAWWLRYSCGHRVSHRRLLIRTVSQSSGGRMKVTPASHTQ